MISQGSKITLVALVVIAGAGVFTGFRLANTKLRQRIDALRQTQMEGRRLRESNQRAKALLTEVAGDKEAAARAVQTEVGRLRNEVAELERRAVVNAGQRSVQLAAEAEALANNRDLQKGLVRLERFQNFGQATPTVAFQTLVWAALKGDDAVLAQVSTLSPAARVKAEEFISGLPEAGRSGWTPEKLAALFFAGVFTEATAAHVVAETEPDALHATLHVVLKGDSTAPAIPLRWQLGPNGWQVIVDEKHLGVVHHKIAHAEGPPSKK
jgi:hypothetical protein